MIYVRTDSIYKHIIKIDEEKGCIKEFDGQLFAFNDASSSYRYENGQRVIKQSENLIDLFDKIVDYQEKRIDKYYTYSVKDYLNLKKCKILDKSSTFYGGIWVKGKCLQFVAVADKKGNWRLLN